ncbi:PaaI family thioesterase [Sandarakinorhabdus sp. DWP1-3-1]|uniref:PaaI family thioesterase n=1 Tax=Sandarakinorhabdus sp. DWP1-3-1 TaxID=2804627 RepID=UPI003CF8685E
MTREHITSGDLAGWTRWRRDPDGRFASLLGDFYFRATDHGVECRMETDRKHSNGLGYIHGGFIMSFIDMAMFAFIYRQLENSAAVTLSCATDFLSAGVVGKPIEASGEILKETGKMLFVRGLVRQDGVNVASFTGTMRKVPRLPRPDGDAAASRPASPQVD